MILNLSVFLLFIALVSITSLKATADTTAAEDDKFIPYGHCETKAALPIPPCCGYTNKLSSRIASGNETHLNEYPWMVRFCFQVKKGKKKTTECAGGTFINSRWILTSARNVQKRKIKKVVIGEWDSNTDPDCLEYYCKPRKVEKKVTKVIVHEAYKGKEHDIALLQLTDKNLKSTDFTEPICLPLNSPKSKNFKNKMAFVAGWGKTQQGNDSSILLKAALKVSDGKKCKGKLLTSQICAAGAEKEITRQGDTGGPLMLRLKHDVERVDSFYQIGIISYEKDQATIATYVPDYIEWIRAQIEKNS